MFSVRLSHLNAIDTSLCPGITQYGEFPLDRNRMKILCDRIASLNDGGGVRVTAVVGQCLGALVA